MVAEPVELHAQPDQVIQGARVHVPGHDRGHRRIARHRGGGVAVQPRARIKFGLLDNFLGCSPSQPGAGAPCTSRRRKDAKLFAERDISC